MIQEYLITQHLHNTGCQTKPKVFEDKSIQCELLQPKPAASQDIEELPSAPISDSSDEESDSSDISYTPSEPPEADIHDNQENNSDDEWYIWACYM